MSEYQNMPDIPSRDKDSIIRLTASGSQAEESSPTDLVQSPETLGSTSYSTRDSRLVRGHGFHPTLALGRYLGGILFLCRHLIRLLTWIWWEA